MGIWAFLTKQRGLGSAAFRWNEPLLYPIRLRRDLLSRIAIVASGWAVASGVFLVLFAFNVNPPGAWLAFALGAVFGLGPAWIAMFFLRGQTAGRITVNNTSLLRHRNYATFGTTWAEWSEWPFGAITNCSIVPARLIAQPFSLLLFTADDEPEAVAIPQRIELKALAAHLASHGIKVSQGTVLPPVLTRPINLMTTLVIGIAGVVMLAAGIVLYVVKVAT